jgi:hypothetical protein
VPKELLEHKVPKETQVHRVHRVHKVLKETQVHRVHKVYKVLKELKEI